MGKTEGSGDAHGEVVAPCGAPADANTHQWTTGQLETIQHRLNKKIGPEFISYRAANGGSKVAYLEAFKSTDLANETFGFNGWSSKTVSVDIDFVDQHPQTGRYTVGVSAIVRITLRDGTYHEDVGYGSQENQKSKATAIENSKKGAVTDAQKRALRNFGSVLGGCLYDKQFLQDVKQVRPPQIRLDHNDLHRHTSVQPRPLMVQELYGADNSALPAPVRVPSELAIISRRASMEGNNTRILPPDDFGSDDLFDSDNIEYAIQDAGGDGAVATTTPENPKGPPAAVQHNHASTYLPPSEFAKPKPVVEPAAPQGLQQTTVTQAEAKRRHAMRVQANQAKQGADRSGLRQGVPPPPYVEQATHGKSGAAATSADLAGARDDANAHPLVTRQSAPEDFMPSFMNPRSLVNAADEPTLWKPNNFETPTIARTAGIDQSRSARISRVQLAAGDAAVSGNGVNSNGNGNGAGNGNDNARAGDSIRPSFSLDSPLKRMGAQALQSNVGGLGLAFSGAGGGGGGVTPQRLGSGGFRPPSKLNTSTTGDANSNSTGAGAGNGNGSGVSGGNNVQAATEQGQPQPQPQPPALSNGGGMQTRAKRHSDALQEQAQSTRNVPPVAGAGGGAGVGVEKGIGIANGGGGKRIKS